MAKLISNAQSINEASALVHGVDAACGPASAYEAAGAIGGFRLSVPGLQNLVSRGENAGTLTTGGQDSQHVVWDLEQFGIGGNVWNAPSQSSLASTLDRNLAANKPTIMGLSEGHFLTDEPSGLHGHFVTVVGKNSNGSYITADPNTVAASHGGFTANSIGQLFAAQGLGNITPNKSAGGSFTTHDITGGSNPFDNFSGNEQNHTGLNSGLNSGISLPGNITVGFDFTSWKSPVTRLLWGIGGAIIVLVSLNNLFGAVGLPTAQDAYRNYKNFRNEVLGEATKAAAVAA